LTPFSTWPGRPVALRGIGMILLTTRRNRSSSIAETYPVGKVRPTSIDLHPPSPVDVPAIRWSVASRPAGKDTDQGLASGPNTGRRLENQFSEPSRDSAWGPEGRLGVRPELFSWWLVLPASG